MQLELMRVICRSLANKRYRKQTNIFELLLFFIYPSLSLHHFQGRIQDFVQGTGERLTLTLGAKSPQSYSFHFSRGVAEPHTPPPLNGF